MGFSEMIFDIVTVLFLWAFGQVYRVAKRRRGSDVLHYVSQMRAGAENLWLNLCKPGWHPARTLRDAYDYITKLPASERNTPESRPAIRVLTDTAEDHERVVLKAPSR